jgi:hypothetical protein
MRTTLSLLGLALLAAAAAGCDGTLDASAPPDPLRFGAPVGDGFPCDVRQVLVTYCADCHAGQMYTPEFLTPEIVRAQALFTGETYGEEMVTRMRDTMRPMPPMGEELRPTEADIAIIAAWVGAGAPNGNCGPLRTPNLLQ